VPLPEFPMLYGGHAREAVGDCNICGQRIKRSWDHVPPKGSTDIGPVTIDRTISTLVSSFVQPRPQIVQDGLKFKTICAKCNARLGRLYDPALNEFAHYVARFVRSELSLPRIVHVEVRPTAIVRAVLGHLLAARAHGEEGGFDTYTRALLSDPGAEVPPEVNVFYWVYPYHETKVLRDFVMPAKRGDFSTTWRFYLWKFFPLAFLVASGPEYERLDSLTRWRRESSSLRIKVPVKLAEPHHVAWPEAPEPDNFLFMGLDGMESVQARPRTKEARS
jgi:hypothetical protein